MHHSINLRIKTKKNTNPLTPKRKCVVGSWDRPAPFSESRHWDWLSGEGQPTNGGELPEVMWLEEAEFRGSLCDLPAWTTL